MTPLSTHDAVRWHPTLGAVCKGGTVHFRVWAPTRSRVAIVLDPGGAATKYEMLRQADGTFTVEIPSLPPGSSYAFAPDGEGPFPDPCSRFQPAGVHGPSAIVDPRAFPWSDEGWQGVALGDAVIYELHVGTFTPEGTFAAAAERLRHLADLGITVVELMPVADFPGSRNWGYDGASLFSPARCYGTPDDVRRFVDTAHRLGLAVILDVVYNHFGPDGAYVFAYSPFYRSARHESPWGAAVNLDGDQSGPVREFFIENALYWLHEFHMDGFRLDATHFLLDDSATPFLADLTQRVRQALPDRHVLLIAEDERNLDTIVRRVEEGGWGLDAVWADDFHHLVHRRATTDRDGYYVDFTGALEDVAEAIRLGWFFTGQRSTWAAGPRGTDPRGIPVERMVICLQNHDQVGNRAFGDRLHHTIDAALYRALSALLLLAPETPLIFMGQEWAASSPFQFFTDHQPELGRQVTQGRRAEFARFERFANPETRDLIPDPQSPATFDASRLRWDDLDEPRHAAVLRLYRAFLRLRRTEPTLHAGAPFDVAAAGGAAVVLARCGLPAGVPASGAEDRQPGPSRELRLVAWLGLEPGTCVASTGAGEQEGDWSIVLSTEEPAFLPDAREARPPELIAVAPGQAPTVRFTRPSAVVMRRA